MKKLLLNIIKLYQKYYSPMRPRRCIFVPTCSQYAVEAITKYGVLKGGFLYYGNNRSFSNDNGRGNILLC